MHDENHTIIYGNREFRKSFGTCLKQTCHQGLMGTKEVCSCCPSRKPMDAGQAKLCKICRRKNGGYDMEVSHTPITGKDGRRLIFTSSFHRSLSHPLEPGEEVSDISNTA